MSDRRVTEQKGVCCPMRSAMACTLLCILVVVGAQAQDRDEDQAAVTQLVHQVVVACNAKDATALESLMIEGAVFAMDAFGEAVVLDRDGLISGPQGLAAMPGAVLKEEVNEVDVASNVAFVRAQIEAGGLGSALALCAAVKLDGAWKLAAAVALPGGTINDELPESLADIVADIQGEGETGMQAALQYLRKEGCLAILGLPEIAMVMVGPENIRQTVNGWDAPTSVALEGKPEARVAGSVAVATFDSVVGTPATKLSLRNAVAFVKQGTRWAVLCFAAAAKSVEPVAPAGQPPQPAAQPVALTTH